MAHPFGAHSPVPQLLARLPSQSHTRVSRRRKNAMHLYALQILQIAPPALDKPCAAASQRRTACTHSYPATHTRVTDDTPSHNRSYGWHYRPHRQASPPTTTKVSHTHTLATVTYILYTGHTHDRTIPSQPQAYRDRQTHTNTRITRVCQYSSTPPIQPETGRIPVFCWRPRRPTDFPSSSPINA